MLFCYHFSQHLYPFFTHSLHFLGRVFLELLVTSFHLRQRKGTRMGTVSPSPSLIVSTRMTLRKESLSEEREVKGRGKIQGIDRERLCNNL